MISRIARDKYITLFLVETIPEKTIEAAITDFSFYM